MTHWFSSLSWLQISWLVYGGLVLLLIVPVWRIERHAEKVDGASGWITFGWALLAFYGLLLMGVITLGKALWNWLA